MAVVDQNDVLSEIMAQVTAVLIFTSSDPQAEPPVPASLEDLDSFLIVQVLLGLEDVYNVSFLEDLSDFTGTTFEDLAAFLAESIRQQQPA